MKRRTLFSTLFGVITAALVPRQVIIMKSRALGCSWMGFFDRWINRLDHRRSRSGNVVFHTQLHLTQEQEERLIAYYRERHEEMAERLAT